MTLQKYSQAIKFNRNIIIAGVVAFFTGASVSQLYSGYDKNEFANSAVTLASEYSVYIPVFAFLFYMDNRQKYRDQATGKKNQALIKSDIKKLLATFSVSEVIFSVAKIASQSQLLKVESLEVYMAAMLSSIIAWTVFLIAVNLMAKIVKLFKHESENT